MKTAHNEKLLQSIIDSYDPHDKLREDELTKRIAKRYAEEYASLRTSKLEELVGLYKKYAELLAESEGNLAVFASTHRIKVDEKMVKKGKQLRQQISELRKELSLK